MDQLFKNKTVFITGGNSGIGLATALLFAKHGANISIYARNEARNQAAVQQIQAHGVSCLAFAGDVTDANTLQSALNQTYEQFNRLDICFNNAGVEQNDGKLISDQTEEMYDQIMDVNVKGVWLSLKYEIPLLLQNGGGVIINTSSLAGLVACPRADVYAAAKHAVISLSKSTALSYVKDKIRCHAICPAGVTTPMVERVTDFDAQKYQEFAERHPMGRCGTPEEIAEAVIFLASDKSAFMTGHSLVLDGGSLLKR